jgi:Arc/MetJ-type ribon-helix-helix transcriptional regulator
MNAHPRKTYILPDHLAEAVERLIASGMAEDFENIVAAGIMAVREPEDPELDTWVEREVAPVLDELERHPERTLSSEQVLADLNAHHAKRLAEG